jgi:gamma-glutamyltranspeptidase / glutathione hydrolase
MTYRRTLALILTSTSLVASAPPSRGAEPPREFRGGVVVAVSAPAAAVGRAGLQQGGNAVDAAVATAFALAVTHPAAGNIGGGGFMLVHPPHAAPAVIDYRETAPAAAHATLFKKGASVYDHKMVGVPGTVRGLALAHLKFGKLPWKALVLPAAALASEGFLLDRHHADSLNRVLVSAVGCAEMKRVFGKDDGRPWRAGDRLIQPDLARTLHLLASAGPDAFYRGPIAAQIAAEMAAGGGFITEADLARYEARLREPIHGTFRGYDVYGPPPPSSGGICLVEMLNVLEVLDLKQHARFSPEALHLLIEAMRRAYCDRALYLGDPSFTKIPEYLTTRAYARKLAGAIDPAKATPSADLAPALALGPEGDSTTHFSIIDRDGLAVANTYTLEHSYGSRIVVKGAGFLLNNEMTDFNWLPGVTTRGGRIGTPPNLIAPGKRMLSSQTPTIVAKNGKVVLVTGSPGGRTIINTVLGVVVNVLEYGMPLQQAIDAPRLHHQWLPDEVRLERADEWGDAPLRLRQLGHRVILGPRQGDAHSLWVNPLTGGYVGAADRRLSGAVAGY